MEIKILFKEFSIDKVDEFMKSIINNYELTINENQYKFAEIELYYKSQEHNDCRVFKRDGKKAGELFFHRFGFDICFESDNKTFGGVLVRSLQDINNNENFICGPLTCSTALLNNNAPNIKFEIKYNNFSGNPSIEQTRRIKGQCKNNFDEAPYRYITSKLSAQLEDNYPKYFKTIANSLSKEYQDD